MCFFKQKTAYEMRISDWSSDVCSSCLARPFGSGKGLNGVIDIRLSPRHRSRTLSFCGILALRSNSSRSSSSRLEAQNACASGVRLRPRSEEHTSELPSLMRISYAVFCMTTNKKITRLSTNKKENEDSTNNNQQ